MLFTDAVDLEQEQERAPEPAAAPAPKLVHAWAAPAHRSRVELVRWPEGLLIFVTAVLYGAYDYWRNAPSPRMPGGFFGWYDQQEYLQLAQVLSSGHLPTSETYSYGLGFPAVAAPFYTLGFRTDPFILPSLILFGLSMVAVYVTALRLADRRVATLTVMLLILATPLVSLVVVPWSSTVSLFCLTVGLYLVTTDRVAVNLRAVALGCLVAWAFASRFVDALPVGLLALCLLAAERDWVGRAKRAALLGVPAVLGVLGVMWTQYVAFGSPFTTPYHSHVRVGGTNDQSLGQYSLARIPTHFLGTFVSAVADGHRVNAAPLLLISPFLLALPLGIAVVLRRHERRGLHITLTMTTFVMALFYLSFVAGGAGDLRFHNARYWMPYYPYWTMLSVIGIRWLFEQVRRRTPEAVAV